MSFVHALIVGVVVAMVIVASVMLFTFMALERIIAIAMLMGEDEEEEDDALDH